MPRPLGRGASLIAQDGQKERKQMKRKVTLRVLVAVGFLAVAALGNAGDWTRTYLPVHAAEAATKQVAIDNAGNVFVLATCVTDGDMEEAVVVKYDQNGTFQWCYPQYDPEHPNDTTNDEAVAFVLAGPLMGPADAVLIAAKALPDEENELDNDYLVRRVNAATGGQEWATRFVRVGDDQPAGIGLHPGSWVAVSGTAYMDETDAQDFYTVWFNWDGSLRAGAPFHQWPRPVGPPVDSARAVTVDGSGNLYITGTTNSSPAQQGYDYDFCTVSYGPDCAYRWSAIRHQLGTNATATRVAALESQGEVYVAGDLLWLDAENEVWRDTLLVMSYGLDRKSVV